MPIIGMFTNLKAADPEKIIRRNAFLTGLQAEVAPYPTLQKIRFVLHHADSGALEGPDDLHLDKEYRDKAAQLASHHAGVYVASCWPTMNALNTATLPGDNIVIAGMFDPQVPNVPQPYGSKVWGYVSFDSSIATAWVNRLRSFTRPSGATINQVGVVYDVRSGNSRTATLVGAINTAVTGSGLSPIVSIDVRAWDLDMQIANFAMTYSGGGLIVPPGTFTAIHRGDIVQAINSNGIPAIYANRLYVNSGGLASYGADLLDLYQKAGHYAGKLLSGQAIPTRVVTNTTSFELSANAALAKKQLNMTAATQVVADANVIYDDRT